MPWIRASGLAIAVLAVLLAASQVGPGRTRSLDDALFAFHAAAAQEPPPTPESTSFVPTPTDTVAAPSPTGQSIDTAVPDETSTPTAVSTQTPFETTASVTPADIETGTPTTSATETGTATPGGTVTMTTTPEATETVIGPEGGTITSLDGHATLSFPAGAVSEPVLVRVAATTSRPRGLPVARVLGLWDFSAFAVQRANAPVHQFEGGINVALSFSFDELFGLNEMGLRYWSYDEATAKWIETPVTRVADPSTFRYALVLDHFSTQATGTDGKIAMPTLLEAASVSLNTGAASYRLPIEVAPDAGAVVPSLALSYDSARMDESDNSTPGAASPSSWVGAGWSLTMPHIARSGSRFYLNMEGVGSELIYVTATQTWRARDEQFLDIAGANCLPTGANADCTWTIRDQSGTTYRFGNSASTKRFYYYCTALCGAQRSYYQWDLAEVVDVHGNKATYAYTPVLGSPDAWIPDDLPVSSYPSSITYPGGMVEFHLDPGTVPSQHIMRNGAAIQVRPDVLGCGNVNKLIIETQRLASIVVKSWDGANYTTARSYDFTIPTTGSDCNSSGATLAQLAIKGKDGGALASLSFGYASQETHAYQDESSAIPCQQYSSRGTNARLTSVENGFGGKVVYDYRDSEVPPNASDCRFDNSAFNGRFPIDSISRTAGTAWSGSQPITSTYEYEDGPAYWDDDARTDTHYVYTGYGKVTVRDAEGYRSIHYFNTADQTAGRETRSEQWDNTASTSEATALWHRVTTTYTTVALATPTVTHNGVYFNAPLSETVLLRDPDGAGSTTAKASETTYTYFSPNVHGHPKEVKRDEDMNNPTSPCLITKQTYELRKDAAVYLVLPKREQTVSCYATSTVLGESENFYDGAGVSGTLTPVAGNLTASRKLTDASLSALHPQKYVYTFSSYYANGLPKESSVPIYQNATMTPTSGGAGGWVPSNKGRLEMQYDPQSVKSATPSPTPVGRFPTKQIAYVYDENGNFTGTQETQYTYDRVLGKVSNVFESAGMETETKYDEFGRTSSVWRTLDGTSGGTRQPGVEYVYSWGSQATPTGDNYTQVKYRLNAGGSQAVEERHCFDGLGRERQTVSATGSGRSLTQRTYDARGLQTNTQVFAWGTSACLAQADVYNGPNDFITYDPLGNPKFTTNSAPGVPIACNPSCLSMDYFGTVTKSYDQLGHKAETTVDGWGRTTATREYTGNSSYALYSTTDFIYDTLGNLERVKPEGLGDGDDTVMTYDALGRKKSMVDPDMSGYSTGSTRTPWTYKYDAAGNLIEQIDARRAPGGAGTGVKVTMTYDSLNRLRSKSYTAPNPAWTEGWNIPPLPFMRPAVTYTYDAYDGDGFCTSAPATAVGRLTKTTDGEVTTRYCYDVRGREVARKTTLTPPDASSGCTAWTRSYVTTKAYDAADRLVSMTYPDGDVVTQTYTDSAIGGGKLSGVSSSAAGTVLAGVSYHVSGEPASYTLGSGMVTTYQRDDRYRLASIVTTSGGATVQALLDYEYDEAGNILRINDQYLQDDLTFAYDDLGRLTSMQVDYVPAASYTYDPNVALGGRIGNMTQKTEGGTTSNFTYEAEHIHGPDLAYDKNGNMTFTGSDGITPDVENRPARTLHWGGLFFQTDYTYDASGEMALRRLTSAAYSGAYDDKTAFVEGVFQERSTFCNAPLATTKSYSAFGRVLAQRTSGTTTYLLADHLGSTTAVVNAAGVPISWHAYWPYGGHRAGAALPTDRGYTGQQYEGGISDTNLYYYHARFYSPALAHFVSPDPTAGDGLNRYAYVGGNPLTRTDPSGYCFQFFGEELGCSTGDAMAWLECGFSASACTQEDGYTYLVSILAHIGMQQPLFWGNVFRIGADINFQFGVLDLLMGAIDSKAVADAEAYFDIIPVRGWETLGALPFLFEVPGSFLKASLLDLVTGSNEAAHLPLSSLIGARPWWHLIVSEERPFVANLWSFLRNRIGGSRFDLNSKTVMDHLGMNTIAIASGLAMDQVDLHDWSNWQRQLLRHHGFMVDDSGESRREAGSYYPQLPAILP